MPCRLLQTRVTRWAVPLRADTRPRFLGLLQDKRLEMEKHGLNVSDYSRTVGKGPGSRPQVPKECPVERSPFFDKVRGCCPPCSRTRMLPVHVCLSPLDPKCCNLVPVPVLAPQPTVFSASQCSVGTVLASPP